MEALLNFFTNLLKRFVSFRVNIVFVRNTCVYLLHISIKTVGLGKRNLLGPSGFFMNRHEAPRLFLFGPDAVFRSIFTGYLPLICEINLQIAIMPRRKCDRRVYSRAEKAVFPKSFATCFRKQQTTPHDRRTTRARTLTPTEVCELHIMAG